MVEIKKQRKQRRNKNHVSGTTNIPFMDDDGNEEVRITTTGGGNHNLASNRIVLTQINVRPLQFQRRISDVSNY